MPKFGMGRRLGMRGMFGTGQWIEGYILLILSKTPTHGYDITKTLADFGVKFGGVSQMGMLYRILRQMEEMDLVASEWETHGGGSPKRVYSLTDSGQEYLKVYVENLKDLKTRIDEFLNEYSKTKNRSE